MAEVRRVLKPTGLFFVTFNSTESGDWGRGRRVDDLTFVKVGGVEDGIPHYFVDRAELERLMGAYELLDVSLKVEWPEDNDGRKAAALARPGAEARRLAYGGAVRPTGRSSRRR